MPSLSLFVLSLLALAPLGSAQSNQDPNINLFLAQIRNLSAMGRVGSFPTGTNGISMETTICNGGTAEVNWLQAMNPDHPFIAFLIARETNGRMEQISDRSFVKHGFFAANRTKCGNCIFPTNQIGTKLGLGCSDTYSVDNNGDRFWLGPADEIDPWLGTWNSQCSYFDQGDPIVNSPNDCNSKRSLSRNQVNRFDPVKQRVVVSDADLQSSGSFYYQSHYTVRREAEAVRGDNQGSRPFNPSWNGTSWNLANTGPLVLGPVLERWSGASVSSNTNAGDDGRVFIGVKVSGPVQGVYHYEYAIQNRDNARGVGAFRIPSCDQARVFGFGFKDVDSNASNDWSVTQGSGELVFSTDANPLRWNTLYNFWFDSDASPEPAMLTLDAFDSGPGSASFGMALSAPTGLYNVYLGDGCGTGPPPVLYATGAPDRALLGNSSFGLASAGNPPGARNVLLVGLGANGGFPLGCSVFSGLIPTAIQSTRVAPNGVALHALAIPNDPALEGINMDLQSLCIRRGPGTKVGSIELSNGLRVRIGNAISNCP